MKSTVEKMSPVRQAVTVEVDAAVVDKAFAAAMEEVRKEAKFPGFRQGKVPDQMLMQKYGREIEIEAIKHVVRETYPAAVREHGLIPLSEPEVEPSGRILHGAPFTYKANVEVYPEVLAKDYEGLKLEKQTVEVLDAEVEGELKRLQRQMTQLEPASDGELGLGMLGKIDFKGTASGQAFPGSEAEDYVVDFGSGTLIEEFEVQIKGMKEQDERDISFHYPTDFFRREIAGKKGEFHVKLKELRRKVVPELNDDFAKSLGSFEDLAAVRTELRQRINAYKLAMQQNQLREQAIRQIIAANQDLEVPTALIDSELGNMLEQRKRQAESAGQTFDPAKIDAQQFVRENLKDATDRARGYMLARAIAEKEGQSVTDAELDERINQIGAEYRSAPAQVREHFEKNNMLEGLRSQMLFEKTLDFVISKAKVKEVKPKKD